MTTHLRRLVPLALIALVGCANPPAAEGDKDEARTLTMSPADLGRDLCEAYGWYDDGECDEFCARPDPDCGTECSSTDDCAPIFCIRAPCPVNDCVDGTCQLRGRGRACPRDTDECEHGTETDEFGCAVCRAAPDCSPVLCEIYCPYGFETGEDGCEICSCAPPPDAPACTSDMDCPQPYCLPGGPCPSNVCIDGECVSEGAAECRSDLDCPQPSCLPGGPCPTIVCEGGECLEDEPACRTNDDCPQPMCLPGGPCPTNVCTPAGECELESDSSGRCLSNDDCGAGQYCSGGCEGEGTCTDIPTDVFCTAAITPYCTCDGTTRYSSSGCIYDRFEHRGECRAEDDCRTSGCGGGEYCSYCWGSWACIPDGAIC